MSFYLHPEYPPEGISRADLHARYGFDHDPMIDRFAQFGLPYNPPEVVPNTKLALQLSELARDNDLHERFHHRLMDAYWAEGTDVGNADVLRGLAGEVGLPEEDVERTIADGGTYMPRVLESTRYAQSIGINGVPAFLLDRRLLISGAQPVEVFSQAIAQLEAM
jgi:predicted DsbA family dithiol-disulfide isomerase